MRISENKCDCSFKLMPITDYPTESTLYDPTWKDSGVLTLVYKIGVDNYATLVDMQLSLHIVDNKPQREVYQLPKLKDGWYKIISYILPTKRFLESIGMVDGYNEVEYQSYWEQCDERNMFKNDHVLTMAIDKTGIWFQGRSVNKVKRIIQYNWIKANIVDVIDEFQTRGIDNNYVYESNVKVVVDDFFNICTLNKCFIDKATQLLSQYKGCSNFGLCNTSIKCPSNVDQVAIQTRDYLWMTLNAIKYAIDCKDYQTANNLLDCLNTCQGSCVYEENNKSCGCEKIEITIAPTELYEKLLQFTFNNYYDKSQVMQLLNNKQDKLIAGTDIDITNNIISNKHKYLSSDDIRNLWENE